MRSCMWSLFQFSTGAPTANSAPPNLSYCSLQQPIKTQRAISPQNLNLMHDLKTKLDYQVHPILKQQFQKFSKDGKNYRKFGELQSINLFRIRFRRLGLNKDHFHLKIQKT